MKRKHRFKIPQMFYLRRANLGSSKNFVSAYVFFNYRRNLSGVVYAESRDRAKAKVRKLNPDAEFFR